MTGSRPSFPHGEEAARACVAELVQKEMKEALNLKDDAKDHGCDFCKRA